MRNSGRSGSKSFAFFSGFFCVYLVEEIVHIILDYTSHTEITPLTASAVNGHRYRQYFSQHGPGCHTAARSVSFSLFPTLSNVTSVTSWASLTRRTWSTPRWPEVPLTTSSPRVWFSHSLAPGTPLPPPHWASPTSRTCQTPTLPSIF